MQQPLEASKWLDFLFFLSPKKLGELLEALKRPLLFRSKGLYKAGEAALGIEELVGAWEEHLSALQEGREGPLDPFYLYLTKEPEAVGRQLLPDGRERLFPLLPSLISQPGRLSYSSEDRVFRITAFGQETLPWGLKWSFPQLYLHPVTREIERGDRFPPSPNAPLLSTLRRWLREETLPVAFRAEGQRIQTPYRLDPALIGRFKHPLLLARGIETDAS